MTYKSKVIAQWDVKQFYVGKNDLNVFKDFNMSASVKTEEVEHGKKMPSSKNISPNNGEISFSIPLNWIWCKDVKKEALWWLDQASKGTTSLLYFGKKPITTNQWKLTSAQMSEVRTVPYKSDTQFVSCLINVSFLEEPSTKKKNKKTVSSINKKMKKADKKTTAKIGKQTRTRKK